MRAGGRATRPRPRFRAAAARLARLAVVALPLVLAGCAPRPIGPAELPVATLLARFEAARLQRETRGAALDADVIVWFEGAGERRLPAFAGRLALAGPDAVRLRVDALFGTALDIGARGDTLAAYVPPRRVGLELDAAADSLGIRSPGALAYRAWTATWRPPADAWPTATLEDSLRVVAWDEAGATLALAVGTGGLPAWLEVRRPERPALRVRYLGWQGAEGTTWPSRIEAEDGAGRYRLSVRVDRLRASADAGRSRVVVRIPDGAERLTLASLRRAIERLGDL